MVVERVGDLAGLPGMIADLRDANITADPAREKLLNGIPKSVAITARDIETHVGVRLGDHKAVVSSELPAKPDLWILCDSGTLLDLPNAKLMGGLPSIADPIGREVTKKLLTGKMRIKGLHRLGLLSKVQRLLSVASSE